MFLKPILSRSTLVKPLTLGALTKYVPKRFAEIGHWNKDYKPGPYPKTFEERLKAAAKYNLDIEDYEPYENGDFFGDYPKLPDICDASKDPYYPWDYPELKRNFGETYHVNADLFGEDRYDIDKYYKLRPPFYTQLAQFLAAVIGISLLICYFERFKMFPSVMPKQFPHQGKIHYTFEECEEPVEGIEGSME